MFLKGRTITLFEKVKIGTDAFNRDIFEEVGTQVDNVLWNFSNSDDITTSTDLFGKKAVITLCIPKGDTHNWKDAKVIVTSSTDTYTLRTFGFPIEGIEELIPLQWNKKVLCEMYE